MPTFLHVGSGLKRKNETTAAFGRPEWTEVRLDIDPSVAPDIVSDMTDMGAVASGSMEALFSSHNLEHLFIHQVPGALAEFRRVLKPDGYAVILCPDLQPVAAMIADDKLHELAYQSPAGGISPHDMVYGFGKAIAVGRTYMAHRCGFTRNSLMRALIDAGFQRVGLHRRPFELAAVAANGPMGEDEILALTREHFSG